MNRKVTLALVIALLAAAGPINTVWADTHKSDCDKCEMKKDWKSGKHYAQKNNKAKSLDKMVKQKAYFFMNNAEEIKLSDEQKTEIEAIKMDSKKDGILKDAEIDVIKLDIHHALKQDPVDIAAVKELISQKYALKQEKAQNFAEAYGRLKDVLDDDQMKKAKEIWMGQ